MTHSNQWCVGTTPANSLLINMSELASFEADLVSVKGLFEQLRSMGMGINYITGYVLMGGQATYKIFRRDASDLPECTVACDGVDHLCRIIKERVGSISYHAHGLTNPKSLDHLIRSSHDSAFPGATRDNYAVPMKGKNGFEGVLLPKGFTMVIVVGTPYGPTFNDIHVAFVQQQIMYGWQGDQSVTDLQSTNYVEGAAYSSADRPSVGAEVYPQAGIMVASK